MNRANNKFKMWKENRTDQEHSMTYMDILKAFVKSDWFDKFNNGLNFDRALRNFITDPKDGLNSTFENDDYDALADFVFAYHNCIERAQGLGP